MQHNLQVEGFGVRLRPVRMLDAAFIVWLRNRDYVRGRVGDTVGDVAGQVAWLAAYYERANDYYFIIETTNGIPVGTYAIYDLKSNSAEAGRWIVRQEVLAAIPSALLLFDLAFSTFRLDEIRVRVVSDNRPVLSLHRKFGFRDMRMETNAQIIGDRSVDMIHFLLTVGEWGKRREQMVSLAQEARIQVLEWEDAQCPRRDLVLARC